MAKQVKKVKAESTASFFLPLVAAFLPLFIATLYLPQANYIPNVVTKLLTLSVAPILVVVVLFSSKRWIKVGFPRNLTITFSIFIGYLLFRALIAGTFWKGIVGAPDRNLGILSFVSFFFFTWIGYQLAGNAKRQNLVHLMTLLGVAEASIANYQYFVGEKAAAITGTFYNSNPVSFLLGIIAASLFAFLLYQKKRTTVEYTVLVLSQLWILIALYVCGSQQGQIIFALVGAVLVVSKFIRVLRLNFGKILFPTFLLALAIFMTAAIALPIRDNSLIAANPILERLEIYKSALKLAVQYPFFGVGVDSFHEKYGQVTLTTLMQLADNAHSVPLHILATLGIIGFALWLVVIYFVLSNSKNETTQDQPEFKFFQVGFFSYLLIGIVGIEHPAIGAISWFMAGVLIRLSSQSITATKGETITGNSLTLEKRSVFVASLGLLTVSLYLLPQQIVVGKALTDLSEQKLTNSQFDAIMVSNLDRLWNPALLLTAGQAYIALEQQANSLVVANVMLKKYPNDQRTSILLFGIASKWNDQRAQELAEQVRDRIFK